MLLLIIFLQGCSLGTQKNVEEYKYAVIHTDLFNKADIHLYNEDGKYLSKIRTKYTGITLGAFMKKPVSKKNKIYMANPLSGNRSNTFILEMDKVDFHIKEISNKSKVAPTVWAVDEKFAYMSGGPLDHCTLTKTDLSTGKQVKNTEINGEAIHMVEDTDKLYLLTFIHSDPGDVYGNINVINKKDLSLIETIKVDDIVYSTDMQLVESDLFLVKTQDGKDRDSNEIIKINLENKKIEKIVLPFKTLNDIHLYKDNIFVTQGNSQREPTEKKIAKYNLKTSEIDTFTIEIENLVSYIHEDKFITSDGRKIIVYDLNSFKKEKEFKLEKSQLNFATFFIN